MFLSKDEARLIAICMGDAKFDFAEKQESEEKGKKVYELVEELQNRLEEHGSDERRRGRTSQDDFYDLLKRMLKRKEEKDANNK